MMIPPMILRTWSTEELQEEAAWLARQPSWVLRTYVGFYAAISVAAAAITLWVVWTELFG